MDDLVDQNEIAASYKKIRKIEEDFEKDVESKRRDGVISLQIDYTPEQIDRIKQDTEDTKRLIEALKERSSDMSGLQPAKGYH